MPRRPRPLHRRPPKSAESIPPQSSKPVAGPPRANDAGSASKRKPQAEPDSQSEGYSSLAGSDGFIEEEQSKSGQSSSDREEDLDAEPDAPRIAQWVDEEDLEDLSEAFASGSSEEEADGSHLEAGLRSLSFGALRKAQKTLAQAQAVSDSEEEQALDDSEPEEEASAPMSRLDKGKEKEDLAPQKKEVPKRKHKHAPMEMSSKRPVSRSRFIAEDKVVPRDPRFMSVTGEFDAKRFHSQYGFLSDLHEDELKTLRDNLKRARKLLANSPRDLREERGVEVERLERALKRAESAVHKDRRENIEKEALSRATKEEREKRKEGKKAWYMKDADRKALLLRAKYDALAATGGKGAVRKAIEKKQKKVGQKEKKKRPFVAGPSIGSRTGPTREGGQFRKRPRSGDEDGSRKRPRAS